MEVNCENSSTRCPFSSAPGKKIQQRVQLAAGARVAVQAKRRMAADLPQFRDNG